MTPPDEEGLPKGTRNTPQGMLGLCPSCQHVRIVQSERGSTFYLCRRASTEPRYSKYPPQPVVSCPGYET
jgi:hypothetical protein